MAVVEATSASGVYTSNVNDNGDFMVMGLLQEHTNYDHTITSIIASS
jgi:hypothetical protein